MKTLEEIKKKVMGNYPYKWIKVFYSKGAGYESEPHNFEGKSIVDETLVEVKGSELSDLISQTKQELIEEIKKAEEKRKKEKEECVKIKWQPPMMSIPDYNKKE